MQKEYKKDWLLQYNFCYLEWNVGRLSGQGTVMNLELGWIRANMEREQLKLRPNPLYYN